MMKALILTLIFLFLICLMAGCSGTADNAAAIKVNISKMDDNYKAGNHTEAIRYADFALEMDPANYFTLDLKAKSLTNLSRSEEALLCYDQIIERCTPTQATYAWLHKAELLSTMGRYPEAITYFTNVIEHGSFYNTPSFNMENFMKGLACSGRCEAYEKIGQKKPDCFQECRQYSKI